MATIFDFDYKMPEERTMVNAGTIRVKAMCIPSYPFCRHAVNTGNGWILMSRPEISRVLKELGVDVPSHLAV